MSSVSSWLRTAGRWTIPILGIVALTLIIAWMSGALRDKVMPGESPPERRSLGDRATTVVESMQTPQLVDAVGTVQPRRKVEVASRLLATVNEILVNPGDSVAVGQQLVELDDREVQAQLREAEAAAAGIEADLAVRQREYERYRRMFEENAVTKEDFDRIEGAYQVTQAQLQRMLEQANRIKVMLTYTQIKAQASGVVADRYVDPGDLAVPGKPLLTVHDPDELELHANVREGLAGRVGTGMKLPIRIDALNLDVEGTVREIVPRSEATSRSLLVKVTLPKDQLPGVYIGMFGRLSIPVGELKRLVVASRAVEQVGQLRIADVVRNDGSLERRFVRTGQQFGDKIEILAGLATADKVALPSP